MLQPWRRYHGLEEQANLAYLSGLTNKYGNNSSDSSLDDIVSELRTQGYTIESVASSGSTITGISLDNSTISISANGTATIKVIKNGYDPSSAGIYSGKNITLNTNGYTVTRSQSVTVSDTSGLGTLNLTGTGTINQDANTPAFKVTGGILNINTDATNITGDIVDWRTCTSSRGYI